MTSLEKNVSLIVDEMYIKPEISYSSRKLSGFANNRLQQYWLSWFNHCVEVSEMWRSYPFAIWQVQRKRSMFVIRLCWLKSGLHTQCVVCDNSKVNQREFGVAVDDSVLTGTSNPASGGSGVFFFFGGGHWGGDTFIWGHTTNTFVLNYRVCNRLYQIINTSKFIS